MDIIFILLFSMFVVIGIVAVAIPEAFLQPLQEVLWGLRAIFGPGGKG